MSTNTKEKDKQLRQFALALQRTWDADEFIEYLTNERNEDFTETVEQLVQKVLEEKHYPPQATPYNTDWELKVYNRKSFVDWATEGLKDPIFTSAEFEDRTYRQKVKEYVRQKRTYDLRAKDLDKTMDIRIHMKQTPSEWTQQWISDDKLTMFIEDKLLPLKEDLADNFDFHSFINASDYGLISDDKLEEIEDQIVDETVDEIANEYEGRKLYRRYIHNLLQLSNRLTNQLQVRVGWTPYFESTYQWVQHLRTTMSNRELYELYNASQSHRFAIIAHWIEFNFKPNKVFYVTDVNTQHVNIDDLRDGFNEEKRDLRMEMGLD